MNKSCDELHFGNLDQNERNFPPKIFLDQETASTEGKSRMIDAQSQPPIMDKQFCPRRKDRRGSMTHGPTSLEKRNVRLQRFG
jgi:hypothetical protein